MSLARNASPAASARYRAERAPAARLLCGAAHAAALAVRQEQLGRALQRRDHQRARLEAVYVCVLGFDLPRRMVARAFGLQHSNVARACELIEERRERDPDCGARVALIGALLGVEV